MDADQYKYETVTQALAHLKEMGYTEEFNFKNDCMFCGDGDNPLKPQDLKITSVYRFEGASDPEDSSVVYAIESASGLKGVIVDSYGAYADEKKSAFINAVTIGG